MIIRRRSAAALCALAAIVAVCLFPPAAAAADEPDTRQAPKVDLVLDASGSMRTRDIDGHSRMAAAKQAFNDVIDAVPQGVDLGIRTLGATYPGPSTKVGCRDTKRLYPVGPLDRTEAKTAVATLAPTGWTPIGPALRAAADDLGGTGSRRIVLISDGEDTCSPPDPCDVAREIASRGVHLTVDTLGLVPDKATQTQLSCIAEATGGTYTSVRHTRQLSTRVKQLVHRTAVPQTTPRPAHGSRQCSTAPQLKPGLFNDRASFSEHRFYRVAVQPGQELRAAVSVDDDRPVDRDYGVLLRAVTGHGREIVRGSQAGSGRTDTVSTGLRYPKPAADSDEQAAETVCLEVSTSFSAPASVTRTPGLPVELQLALVDAPHQPSDVAAFGLGRGWWLLATLAAAGAVAGVLFGWIMRWRRAWRQG